MSKTKLTALFLCVILTLSLLCGCAASDTPAAETEATAAQTTKDDRVTIPDLAGTDVDSAKTILVGKGLIPVVSEVKDETVKEGNVVRTEPAAGEKTDPDSTVTVFVSTGAPMMLPKLIGKTEEQALTELKDLGLVPDVRYQNDDEVEAGLVTSTSPGNGSNVEKGQTVIVYISEGPEYVYSQNSYLSWKNQGNGQDEWEFYSPYKHDGYLFLECYNVTIQKTFEWQDRYDKGVGLGKACLNDNYDKTVPVEVLYDNVKVKSGESFFVTIKIPLSELDTEFPTDLYMELFTVKKHTDTNTTPLKLELSVTW